MPGSDRALRRLVADLTTVEPDDLEAILGGLDAPQRERVEALLAEYRGEVIDLAEPEPAETGEPEGPRINGLSPWLAARLERPSRNKGETDELAIDPAASDVFQPGMTYSLTAQAFEALREAASDLEGGHQPARGDAAKRRFWPGLFRKDAQERSARP